MASSFALQSMNSLPQTASLPKPLSQSNMCALSSRRYTYRPTSMTTGSARWTSYHPHRRPPQDNQKQSYQGRRDYCPAATMGNFEYGTCPTLPSPHRPRLTMAATVSPSNPSNSSPRTRSHHRAWTVQSASGTTRKIQTARQQH